MTDYNIKITVDVSQADAASAKVAAGLEAVDTQAAGSTKAMNTLIAEFERAAAAARQFSAAASGGLAQVGSSVRIAATATDQLGLAANATAARLYAMNVAADGLGTSSAATAGALHQTGTGLQTVGTAAATANTSITGLTAFIAQMERQLLRTAEHLAAFAVLIGGAFVVHGIASFDQELGTLKGITGATESQMARLKQAAMELASTGRFAADEITKGMIGLAKSGMPVEQIFKRIDTVMNFAQAHRIDPTQSANILTQGMHGMRLRVDDLEHIADVFTAVAKTSTSTVEQMMTAFKYAAPIMSGFGNDINTTGAAIAVLSANGIDASMAGTTLRNVLSRIGSPTKEFREDLKRLGITFDEINPATHDIIQIMERFQKVNNGAGISENDIFALFKQRGGTGVDVLMSRTAAMREYRKELEIAQGRTTRLTGAQNDTLTGDFLNMVANLKNFTISLGDATGLTQTLRAGLELLSAAFKALNAIVVTLGPTLKVMAATWALMNFPMIAAGVTAVGTAFLTAARGVLVFMASLGPIGWIVAVIGAIAMAFTLWGNEIYKINGGAVTLSDVWQAALIRIKGLLGPVVLGFVDCFTAVFNFIAKIVNAIIGLFEAMFGFIMKILQKIGDAANSIGITMNKLAENVKVAGTGGGSLTALMPQHVREAINPDPGVTNNSFLPEKNPAFHSNMGLEEATQQTTLLGEAELIAQTRIAAENAAISQQNQLSQSLAAGLDNPRSKIDHLGAAAEGAEKKHKKLKDAFDMLFGSAEKGANHIAELKEMFASGMISESQFADGIQRAREELWKMDQTPMGGILKGLNEVAAGATRIGDHISKTVVQAFGHMTDAIVEFAKTGKFNFKKMAESIAEDLLRLTLNNLWGQLAKGLLGGAGGAGGAGMMATGIGALFGFAGGGNFTVGGHGSTDSQLVAFRATPGEQVNVSTPQQASNGNGPSAVNVAPPDVHVRIVNSMDPQSSIDALSTRAGEQAILNIVQRNPVAFRRILGSSS